MTHLCCFLEVAPLKAFFSFLLLLIAFIIQVSFIFLILLSRIKSIHQALGEYNLPLTNFLLSFCSKLACFELLNYRSPYGMPMCFKLFYLIHIPIYPIPLILGSIIAHTNIHNLYSISQSKCIY
jgi:hypothetical protein